MRNYFLLLVFVLIQCVFGQQKKIDSLLRVLPQSKDTNRCKVLLKLSYQYSKTDPQKGVEWAKKGLAFARSIGSNKFMNDAYYKIGMYLKEGPYKSEALKYMDSSRVLTELDRDERGLAMVYNAYGTIYNSMEDYPQSIRYYIESVKIKEKYAMKSGLANTYINLANSYNSVNMLDKSEFYLKKAAGIMKAENNYMGIAATANLLGTLLNRMNNFSEALKVLEDGIKVADSLDSDKMDAALNGNLSESYTGLGNYTKAKQYGLISIQLKASVGDSGGVSYSASNLASICIKLRQYDEAIAFAERSLRSAETEDYKEGVYYGHKSLSEVYAAQGNFKEAYKFLKLSQTDYDSLQVIKSQQLMSEMEGKYQLEKKETEIQLQNEKLKSNDAEIKKKNQQQIFFWIGISLFALLAVFVFRSYYIKKKSNEIILRRNREVEEQKAVIEEKQKEILDSIRYAHRIQKALITSEKYINKSLKKMKSEKQT